ncbi:MAG: radical SAM protein [Candidatus Caldarchaeum sp.]
MHDTTLNEIPAELTEQKFDFLWLELTSRCNLRCVHCYAESSPNPRNPDVLSAKDYYKLIDSAASLGCRKIQFIGGEPTLVRELPQYIIHARNKGFDFIEVFTNATIISNQILSCFVDNQVAIATSFYSYRARVHDAITKRPGSHSLTEKTIKRLLDAGLTVRVGIISMKENKDEVDNTVSYLHSIGVRNVGIDRVRFIGRGSVLGDEKGRESVITELCGYCWQGNLCICPDGKVVPCIMARNWPVGSVLEQELSEIIYSQALHNIRSRIYKEVWLPRSQREEEHPIYNEQKKINTSCPPNCVPRCVPQCSPNCSPCYPYGKCNPELFPR